MDKFLAASRYIDFDADNIQAKIYELFSDSMSSIDKARIAFEFVRDKIPHSFDCDATVITARRRKVDGGNSYPHTGIIPLSIPAA